jgi:hypothetical protein
MPCGRKIDARSPFLDARAYEQLSFELRPLIDVAGRIGRILVRRNFRHVAVHADGAAVNQAPPHCPCSTASADVPRALDVDVVVVAVRVLRSR